MLLINKMNLQESIRRILREELYSPAGKEITPNKIVVHKSNPMFRDRILEEGLKVRVGECYQIYVNREQRDPDEIKCKPVIFATNSKRKKDWFDSTYDDDIWVINTECAGVNWFKDKHYDNDYHIVTFENISPDCLKLIHKGTGESEDMLQENTRRTLREENELLLRARRRISVVDDLLSFKVRHYYKPESICRYESGEELVEVVMAAVIDHMYWDYFGDIDDTSKEWKIIFDYFEDYIKDKYGEELKKYYHINCGD